MDAARSDLSSWLSCADKIIVYDLEWTSWAGFAESGWSMPGKHCEVIQIGAVKIDCQQNFREIGTFDLLVKPKINPDLSDYIQALTGLSQKQIDADGVAFPQAILKFHEFCEDASFVCSNGTDDFVIAENCALHEIDCPNIFKNGVDLRPLFSKALGITGCGIDSCNLTSHLGLPSVGDHHDALADSRGIAAALLHLTAH